MYNLCVALATWGIFAKNDKCPVSSFGQVLKSDPREKFFSRLRRWCLRPLAEDVSACGRRSSSSHARKNLWYPASVEKPDWKNPDSQTSEIVRGPFACLPQARGGSVRLESLLLKKSISEKEEKSLAGIYMSILWMVKIYPGKTRFNRSFSVTWSAALQIAWSKRKF